jgi:hypothetical protein
MPGINSAATYWSTEMAPKTVTVVDTRTCEEVFAMDIPPGKQLVMNFSDDNPQYGSSKNTGDDPVHRPALMTYQVMDLGQQTGRLQNSLTVPGLWARRVDVTIRKSGEIAPTPPEVALRADQEADRPAWWTPKGGAMPPKYGDSNYDR